MADPHTSPFHLCVAATLAFAAGAAAQTDSAGALPAGAPEGLAKINAGGLKKHATYLASDELGGRYTGTPGQIAAAEYIAKHFESLGLEPLGDKRGAKREWFQKYPLERTWLDPKGTSIAFGGKTYSDGFAVLPGKDDKRVRTSGRLLYCGTGNPDDLPKSVARTIPVVLLRSTAGGPAAGLRGNRQMLRARDANGALASRGARLVVFLLPTENSGVLDALNYASLLPAKHHLVNRADPDSRPLPRHAVPSLFLPPEKSRDLLKALGYGLDARGDVVEEKKGVKASGRVSVHVRHDPKFHAVNVCAVLRGTSNQAIVYSAHMDHMGIRIDGDPFNGADDNASGTSGLLAIAEAYATSQDRPRRSVVFLAVSGEELGLWGSRHYSESPTWPLGQIAADINIDMIGRDTSLSPKDAVSVTPSRSHPKYSTLVKTAEELGGKLGMRLTSGDKYYMRSDHYNFARKGVPVVFFCDGEHADYHKVTDHADKLDYGKMERIARLAFWTGWVTANAPGRPRSVDR